MRKRKNILGAILALILTMNLMACSNTGDTNTSIKESTKSEDNIGDTKEEQVIKVFAWGNGQEVEAHKKKVELFNKSNNKGITAKIECVPNAEYNTKLNAMITANKVPDVIMESADFNGFYYRNGDFENLTPFLEKDNLNLNELLVSGMDVGNIHGDNEREALAFTGNTMVYAYNKDIFDKMGVDYPKPGWTWSDFLEICKKLTSGEGNNKQFAISDHWAVKTFAHYAAGGQLYDISSDVPVMTANDKKTIEGLEMYADLIRQGFMPDATAAKGMPSEQRFFSGFAAMIPFFTWDSQMFYEGIGDSFAWDVVELPKADNGTVSTLTFTTGLAMSSNSNKKDAAWEFIKFFCLSEESNKENEAVGMPVLNSLVEEYSQKNIVGTQTSYGLFFDVIKNGRINPFGGSFSEISDEFTRYWDGITIDNLSVEESMNKFQETGQPILEKLMK